MTIIVKPSIIRKGDLNQLELDQEQLLLHPVVAANEYYSNTKRWRFIMLTYVTVPNGNVAKVVFDPNDDFITAVAPDPVVFGDFTPSEFAENDFQIRMLSIYGFDNSSLDVYRSDLDTVEFDILLTDSYGFYSYRLLPLQGALQLGGGTIQTHLTTSMWYKYDTTQTLGAKNYLMSIGYGLNSGDAEVYLDASGFLYLAAHTGGSFSIELVNGVNIDDGNWHSLILSYSGAIATGGYEECRLFIDGVKEQEILGLNEVAVNNVYVANPTANELTPLDQGCRGSIAQFEVWGEYFDTSQAVQYHNNGSVLNPNLHIFASALLNDWTFGDNELDDGLIVADNKGVFDLTILEAQGTPSPFRSGSTEPIWQTLDQALTEDLDIVWDNIDDDATNPPIWTANAVYDVGDIVSPSVPNGKLYVMANQNRIRLDQP